MLKDGFSKRCFCFSTWKEQKDVMISLDGEFIAFKSDIDNIKDNVLDFVENSLDKDSLSIYFNSLSTRGYGSEKSNIQKIIDEKDFTNFIEKSIPQDEILQKLCEKTGVKMYGDYVLFSFMKFNDFAKNLNDCQEEAMYYFEQYSKFLRGEENKFEEVKKFLDI
jgi:hypothetical protein